MKIIGQMNGLEVRNSTKYRVSVGFMIDGKFYDSAVSIDLPPKSEIDPGDAYKILGKAARTVIDSMGGLLDGEGNSDPRQDQIAQEDQSVRPDRQS